MSKIEPCGRITDRGNYSGSTSDAPFNVYTEAALQAAREEGARKAIAAAIDAILDTEIVEGKASVSYCYQGGDASATKLAAIANIEALSIPDLLSKGKP
jgi:SHS2 domain-containing protein